MNPNPNLTKTERDLETSLREYEKAHAVWMDTRMDTVDGRDALRAMETAGVKLATARRAFEIARGEAVVP